MPVPMPPLNALRAFEAAARHLSLTRAAEELHVTAGALSHQIRSLEEFLGVKLFERRGVAVSGPPARAALSSLPPPPDPQPRGVSRRQAVRAAGAGDRAHAGRQAALSRPADRIRPHP